MIRGCFIFFVWAALLKAIRCNAAKGIPGKVENATEALLQNERTREAAARDFSIVLSGNDDELSSRTTVVYRKGVLGEMWQIRKETYEGSAESERHLFQHGPYTDRISFDVSYSAGVDTDFADPDVYALNDSIARPKVTTFSIDKSERYASLTIVYDCHHQRNSTDLHSTLIFITVPVISGFEIQFALRKTCGGGRVNPHLDFGYITDSAVDGSQTGQQLLRQTTAGSPPRFTAGPHHLSTRLFLQLHEGTQEFFHAEAKSSNSDQVDVALRGPVFGGVLTVGRRVVLHAIYTCEHHGQANISISIPIPPFAPLEARWTKDCGGGFATGLFATTDGADNNHSGNVIAHGQTKQRWSDGSTVINASTGDLNFHLRNRGPPLHIGQVSVTVDRHNTVYGYVVDPSAHPLRFRSSYLGGDGGFFGSGGYQQLHVEVICKRMGSSRVNITIPFQAHDSIEISFRKQCKTPRQRHHSGLLRTANSLLNLFVVVLSISGYALFWVQRRIGEGRGSKACLSGSPEYSFDGPRCSTDICQLPTD